MVSSNSVVVDLPVVARRIALGRRRDIGQEDLTLGPEGHAARLDGQGCGATIGAAGEDVGATLAPLDRQSHADHGRNLDRPRCASGIEHRTGRDRASGPRPDLGDARPGPGQPDHLVGQIGDTQGTRLLAQGLEQGVGIQPALVAEAEKAARQTVDRQPGKPRLQGIGVEKGDLGAMGPLDLVIGGHGRQGRGRGQQEIALLVEADRGRHAIDLEQLAGPPGELGAEQADLDVLGGRELLADTAGGPGRGRIPIAGVALDHQHRAVEIGIGRQEVGGGAANHAAACDDHVVAGAHGARRSADIEIGRCRSGQGWIMVSILAQASNAVPFGPGRLRQIGPSG